jgi:hypothetical protein
MVLLARIHKYAKQSLLEFTESTSKLHPVKVGVLCALSARRIVRPVFFNERVNCERYIQVFVRQFFSKLTEEERLYGWFQQTSATAHTTHMSMQALSNVFRDRIISSDIWPAHSPDLNPCDFFFWGCLKDEVYSNNPRMEQERKENIHREISNIPAEHLQKVNQKLFCPCEECLCIEEQHFQHLQ